MINANTPSLASVAPLTMGVPDGNTGRPSSIRTLPKKTCEGVFAPPTSPSFWEVGCGGGGGGDAAAAAGASGGDDDSVAKPVKQASSSAVAMQTHWSEPGQHNQV